MHEPAGVVEILVQILQNTPILKYSFRIPPPKMKIVRDLGTLTFQFQNTPPQKIEIWADLGTLTFQFQNTPPQIEIWADLGTLTFQFQNTPPPENWNLGRSWHFDFSVSEYPPPPRKLKFGQILALWLFSFRIPPQPPTPNPPPPRKLKFGQILAL